MTRSVDHRIRGAPWEPWALIALALAVRLPGALHGSSLELQEAYPLKIALRMWGANGTPVTLDPGFFHYPSLAIDLQFALLGILRLALWVAGVAPTQGAWLAFLLGHPDLVFRLGELLSVGVGSLLVLPAWWLGARAGEQRTGLVAGLFVAANPFLVTQSQLIGVDSLMALCAGLAVCAAVALAESGSAPSWPAIAGAGALAGLAASAKYPGALSLLAVVAGLLASRKLRGGRLVVALVVATGAAAAAFALTSPFLFLDPVHARSDLAAERAHVALGHFGSEHGAALLYYAGAWFTGAFGWFVGALALVGLVDAALVRRRTWTLVALAFAVPLGIALGLSSLKADRYVLPLVPLGSVGAAALALGGMRRVRARPAGVVAASALALACLATDAPHWADTMRREGADARTVAGAWIAAHVSAGAMIVTEAYGPVIESPLRSRVPAAPTPGTDGRHADDGAPRYWVVPVPMFQVAPEQSAVYYDPRLYTMADRWVVCAAVRDRYRREPARFPVQCAFYAWLAGAWPVEQTVESPTGAGAELVIYRNPSQSAPFAARVTPPPEPLPAMERNRGVEGEAAFYYALGLDYYGFGHYADAAQCFALAGHYPIAEGGVTPTEIERAYLLSRNAEAQR